MLYEVSERSKLAEPEIAEARQQLQRACSVCRQKVELCQACAQTWLTQRACLVAGLPLAKAMFALAEPKLIQEQEVVACRFTPDDKAVPDATKRLYADVLDPYLGHAEEVRRGGHSLLFPGDRGTGKTVAGAYLVLGMLLKRYSAHFITFPELHKHHTRASSGAPELRGPATDLLEEIQKVDFLVVDELGGETTASESVRYLADTFLKAREENLRPTLLITNTPVMALHTNPKEGEKGYGPRFWAMLQERYRIYHFQKKVNAPNLRLSNRLAWPF